MPLDANRVSETSTTVGTGTVTLGGALVGHQTFATAYGVASDTEVPYGIVQDVTGEWEVGIGTFLASQNKLQRDVVQASSDGGSKVAFPTGSKIVYVTVGAESMRTLRAARSTDVALTLRGAAGQTASIMQFFDNSGDLALEVDSVGKLKLTSKNSVMMHIPMNDNGTGDAVQVQSALLPLSAPPADPGIRFRMSGGGTQGLMQWSEGDTSYVQLQAATGQLRASQGTDGADGLGITFVNGIKLLGNNAEVNGAALGHIGFDCGGGSGASIWDISPGNNTGSNTHTVRVGRRSAVGTKVELTVVLSGTTTPRVTLDSTGRVEALYGDFGNYKIGMGPSGAADATLISSDTDAAFIARSGIDGDGAFFFRDVGGTLLARIDDTGTAAPTADTLMTRQKGDARYAAISSHRFKAEIEVADGLVPLFGRLVPKSFIWGGEVPKVDERYGTPGLGFIAEEVVKVIPEAGRYVRVGEGKDAALVLQSLDPLAIVAVLHAKLAEVDRRLGAIEAQPQARQTKPRRR
jgi:hypothetical protein